MPITDEMRDKIKGIAKQNKLQCYPWLNMSGGRGWICYDQIEENDYVVQISLPGTFDEYKEVRDAISSVFEKCGCVLSEEKTNKQRVSGFSKEILYMDKEKYERQTKESRENVEPGKGKIQEVHIGTQINGPITTNGSVNTGAAERIINKTSSEADEKKWFQKEFVKMLLSFIAGVASTIVAQWIMRLLGWIQ